MRQLHELFSPAYVETQRALHARPEGYGGKGRKWAPTVLELTRQFSATSVLDYGCGQGTLAAALRDTKRGAALRIAEYDPAVTGKDAAPSFADLVMCTDVLEHIEPERLPAVLDHIRRLARRAAFLVVALDPSNKTLLDGRNAHLILESPAWWADQVARAGLRLVPEGVLTALPLPGAYANPEKRAKRWIAVVTP